jgi:hypothetical protein
MMLPGGEDVVVGATTIADQEKDPLTELGMKDRDHECPGGGAAESVTV